MESEANGKETVTFSTVTKSTCRPEEDKKEGRRRIKPAKVKRDRERRDAWLERRRTGVGKSVAVVPAVAPVTEPEPITPEGTGRTMVTGSSPEEAESRRPEPAPKTPERTGRGPAERRRMRPVDDTCGGEPCERRRPVEERSMAVELVEPAPVPYTPFSLGWWGAEHRRLRLLEESCGGETVGRPAAEVPAAAPVTVPSPAPVTRNLRGTWSVHPPSRGAYGDRSDLRYAPPIVLRRDGVYTKDGRTQKGILERTETEDPPLMY